MLSDYQKQALLDLARRSVLSQVTGAANVPGETAAAFPDASGVFVTLTLSGDLRGCLGTLQCRAGLAAEVVRCAADAASIDPRFPPLGQHELHALALEVSVLGPLEPIDPRTDGLVVVGRHGLMAEQGDARGLLLPQVATEHEWTREQFLRQTCVKAGLHPAAWQRGAVIYRFEAEVFGEPWQRHPDGAQRF